MSEWRPDNKEWVRQRNIYFQRNNLPRPYYKIRQKDFEAGAAALLDALFKLAEESPTKTFTIDSGGINVFKGGNDDE